MTIFSDKFLVASQGKILKNIKLRYCTCFCFSYFGCPKDDRSGNSSNYLPCMTTNLYCLFPRGLFQEKKYFAQKAETKWQQVAEGQLQATSKTLLGCLENSGTFEKRIKVQEIFMQNWKLKISVGINPNDSGLRVVVLRLPSPTLILKNLQF